MNQRSAPRRALGMLASAVVGVAVFAPAAVAAPTGDASDVPVKQQVGLGGTAFGSVVYDSDKTISSGPIGMSTLNCLTETGLKETGDAASTDLGSLGRAGATESKVETFEKDGWKGTKSTSHIAGASLLGGAIKVGAITSTSIAKTNGTDYRGVVDSEVVGLKIAGQKIDVEAKPGTKVELELPGVGSVGTVEVNKQVKVWLGDEYHVGTDALHITILKDNPLGLKVGTTVRLGVSGAKLTKPVDGLLGGMGFTTKASIAGKLIGHGPTGYATMRCTGGKTTGNIAAVDIPGVLRTGVAETKTEGKVLGNNVHGVVTNKVGEINIAGGLITADAITAKATAAKTGGTFGTLDSSQPLPASSVRLSDKGTKFVNLKVAGKPVISDNVEPNTKIDVAGLGTVTLRKTVREGTRISVTMIEVKIGNADLQLQPGTKVQIGHATVSVKA